MARYIDADVVKVVRCRQCIFGTEKRGVNQRLEIHCKLFGPKDYYGYCDQGKERPKLRSLEELKEEDDKEVNFVSATV